MNCANRLCKGEKKLSLSYIKGNSTQKRYCSNACRLQDLNSSAPNKEQAIARSFMEQGKFLSEEEANARTPKMDNIKKYYEPVEKDTKLGKGAYGEVILMREKSTGKLVAVKIVEKANISNKKILTSLINETKIQKRIIHDNIIRVLNHLEDNNNIYIIMEYAEKENLFRYIREKKKLLEAEAYSFFKQTCNALCFLHAHNLMHRDVKPENLLLTNEGKLKLCDFGFCAQYDNGSRLTCCGTIEYMAPELFKKEKYGEKVDVWSLGVLLYEMLHGYAPYHGRREQDTVAMILKTQVEFGEIKEDAKNLIRALLKENPKERPEVWRIFNHPWMKRMEDSISLKSEDVTINKVIHNPVKLLSAAYPQKINNKSSTNALPKKKCREEDLFKGAISKSPVPQPTVIQIINQKPQVKSIKKLEEDFMKYRSRPSKRDTKIKSSSNPFSEEVRASKFDDLNLEDMNFVINGDPLSHVNKYLDKLSVNPKLKWEEALIGSKDEITWVMNEYNKKLMGMEEELNESYSSDDYIFQRSETLLKAVDYLDDIDMYPYVKSKEDVLLKIKKENEILKKICGKDIKSKEDTRQDKKSLKQIVASPLNFGKEFNKINKERLEVKDSEYKASIDKMMNLLVDMENKGLHTDQDEKEVSEDKRTFYYDIDKSSDLISESDYDSDLQKKFDIEAKENRKLQRSPNKQNEGRRSEENIIANRNSSNNSTNRKISKESSRDSKKSDESNKSNTEMKAKTKKSVWDNIKSLIVDNEL